jgi:hypothetical protein
MSRATSPRARASAHSSSTTAPCARPTRSTARRLELMGNNGILDRAPGGRDEGDAFQGLEPPARRVVSGPRAWRDQYAARRGPHIAWPQYRCPLGLHRSSPWFSTTATTHPAYIPQEVAGSSRPHPPIPARPGPKDPLTAGIPADPRSARKRHDQPVTPEVAGSSPVAPALEVPAKTGLRCPERRKSSERNRSFAAHDEKTGRNACAQLRVSARDAVEVQQHRIEFPVRLSRPAASWAAPRVSDRS